MKKRRVAGEVTISFTAEVPGELKKSGLLCDDPAVEAVLSAVGGECQIFLWGVEHPPVSVHVEIFEEDVNIEEDEDVEE